MTSTTLNTAHVCTCANCPGAGCQCGCQTVTASAACNCGPACGCEGPEQGCVCQ
jgi:hypothetical protein